MMVSNAIAVQAGDDDRENIPKVHVNEVVTVVERRAPVAIPVELLRRSRSAAAGYVDGPVTLDAPSRSVGFGKMPRPRHTGPESDAAPTATVPDQYRWWSLPFMSDHRHPCSAGSGSGSGLQ